MSINKVLLLGRLGKDAELTYTPTGLPVLKASLATSESFKGKDGKSIDKTEWHNLIDFSKRGEALAKYLVKGKQIYVEGRLQTREWTDKNNVKRWATNIVITDIQLLGDANKEAKHPDQEKFDQVLGDMAKGVSTEFDNDYIPF